MAGRRALVIAGIPDTDANLLHVSSFPCPDTVAWFRVGGRSYLMVNDLELERAKRVASVDVVMTYSRYLARAPRSKAPFRDSLRALAEILSEKKVRQAEVPRSFPAAGVSALRLAGIRVRILPDPFLPGRSHKSPGEVRKMCQALRAAETGMGVGIQTLLEARIERDGTLGWGGRRLTAAILRERIDRATFSAGAIPAHTIVAGGRQGSDPHARGSGPLPAHRPIVVDLFPRSRSSGYYADITRTVVKGKAAPRIREVFLAVATAQELAIEMIRPHVPAPRIHAQVCAFFDQAGFPTKWERTRREGFIHGTGHGIGLELHEDPVLSLRGGRLEEGNVLTVEPGLYYEHLGGVRLEDMVLVTRTGCRNLTRFPIFLEIP